MWSLSWALNTKSMLMSLPFVEVENEIIFLDHSAILKASTAGR